MWGLGGCRATDYCVEQGWVVGALQVAGVALWGNPGLCADFKRQYGMMDFLFFYFTEAHYTVEIPTTPHPIVFDSFGT